MYCSSCGNILNPNLRFCNRCGAKTGRAKKLGSGQLADSTVNLLIAAVLGLPIVTIGLLMGVAIVLKNALNFAEEWIIITIIIFLVFFLAAELGLLWLLFSRTRASRSPVGESGGQNLLEVGPTRSLDPAKFGPENIGLENTTRTLESVPRKHEDKEDSASTLPLGD